MSEYIEMKLLIDFDLYEKLTIALQLNKENQNDALISLIRLYIANSFSKASKEVSSQSPLQTFIETNSNDNDPDSAKALRKIPNWAQKSHQNNHRIIKAFFELQEKLGTVTLEALSDRCSNPIQYPATFTSDFRGNFASMKTDAGNSHGKVFEVRHDIVSVWTKVNPILEEYKVQFIGSEENRAFNKLFSSLLSNAINMKLLSIFNVKSLFGSEWESISFNSRRLLGREFFNYVNKGFVKGIRALPEKDEENSQLYEKV